MIVGYEILKLERRVFVPIPEGMTKRVDIPYAPDGPFDVYTENATLAACQVRMQVCNGKLDDVSKVQGTLKETLED